MEEPSIRRLREDSLLIKMLIPLSKMKHYKSLPGVKEPHLIQAMQWNSDPAELILQTSKNGWIVFHANRGDWLILHGPDTVCFPDQLFQHTYEEIKL